MRNHVSKGHYYWHRGGWEHKSERAWSPWLTPRSHHLLQYPIFVLFGHWNTMCNLIQRDTAAIVRGDLRVKSVPNIPQALIPRWGAGAY